MSNHRIDIIVKNLNIKYFEGMLKEFFQRDRTPTFPIYIRFDAKFKPIGNGMANAIYSNFQVVEASKDEEIWYIVIASIEMQQYPSHIVVIIEGTKGKEKDWKKVNNIVREIITQMGILKFEIDSIKPVELLPKELIDESKILHKHSADEHKPIKTNDVPKSHKRYRVWQRTWQLIMPMVDKGNKTIAISNWLKNFHPDLPHSRSVLVNIIRAGIGGELIQKSTKT